MKLPGQPPEQISHLPPHLETPIFEVKSPAPEPTPEQKAALEALGAKPAAPTESKPMNLAAIGADIQAAFQKIFDSHGEEAIVSFLKQMDAEALEGFKTIVDKAHSAVAGIETEASKAVAAATGKWAEVEALPEHVKEAVAGFLAGLHTAEQTIIVGMGTPSVKLYAPKKA